MNDNRFHFNSHLLVLLIAALLVTSLFPYKAECAEKVRIGHFPNITHAQPIIGRSLGIYEKKMGVPLDWKVFNAGPSEMEALIAGQLDIAYVGPNPAINAFLRSKGKALTIIAGSSDGGAALVVPKNASISSAIDFKGKRIASPELGNTQDVALRFWLKNNGMIHGRDLQVVPIKNADILMLFQQSKLDGAWVPEPWTTRLLQEGGAKIYLDERTLWPGGRFSTGVVVVRSDFYAKNPDTVKRFLDAHVEITDWIGKNKTEAMKRLNSQLAVLVGKPIPDKVLLEAFSRVKTTYDPLISTLMISAQRAETLGYLPRKTDLSNGLNKLVDLRLLNQVLKQKSLPPIKDN
jgi:NitT/TauT family transport system substrate-binding protein